MAAPEFSAINYTMLDADVVEISGFVSDESPGTVTVRLSGAVSGTAAVNEYGYFTYQGVVNSIGDVSVVAIDSESLPSGTRSLTLQNTPPVISSLYVYATGNGADVVVCGQVSDDFVAGSSVQLTGQVNASLSVDRSGCFSASLTANGVGSISAQAKDFWGWTSNVATSSVEAAPPTAFVYVTESGPNRQLTLSGSVSSGLYGALADVAISGVLSASTSVDSSGQITITQQASAQGNMQVQVTNLWGLFTIQTTVFQTLAPQISGLCAMSVGGGYYDIRGAVSDEFAGGLTVQIDGILGSYAVKAEDNGSFSLRITADEDLQGNVTAMVTDWWGVASQVQYASIV